MRITIDSLVAEVTKLCTTRPDVCYDNDLDACSYLQGTCSDKSRGCVIGQAFRNLGITATQLKEIDLAGSIRQVFYATNSKGEYYRDVVFSSCDATENVVEKIEWLKRVQHWQDHGYSWGECFQHANELLETI